MTQVKTLKTTKVTKAGDWVLPVLLDDGTTVYALQINKSAEDKQNITELHQAYIDAGIEVYEYAGKNNNPVLLVDATKKIRSQRVGVLQSEFIAELVNAGVPQEVAELAYANAKANAKARASKVQK